MALTRVTITGADDGVDPKELVALSKSYPFVEWGVLLSESLSGQPRYPTNPWCDTLCDYVTGYSNLVNLSFHLCGEYAREVMAGGTLNIVAPMLVKRVQLNGFSNYVLPGLKNAERHPRITFILQCTSEEALVRAGELRGACMIRGGRSANVTALFDPSGGRAIRHASVRPSNWPVMSLVPMGYAGGIAPDNVVRVLEELASNPAAAPYWIDMESGVRTDDRFDLDKVRRVLELAATFVKPEAT